MLTTWWRNADIGVEPREPLLWPFDDGHKRREDEGASCTQSTAWLAFSQCSRASILYERSSWRQRLSVFGPSLDSLSVCDAPADEQSCTSARRDCCASCWHEKGLDLRSRRSGTDPDAVVEWKSQNGLRRVPLEEVKSITTRRASDLTHRNSNVNDNLHG